METEIAKRVGAGWMNWKKCSGVLCDKKMPVKLKRKVYRTVVRPAMLYGAETWATTKRQESRIEVNEMKKKKKKKKKLYSTPNRQMYKLQYLTYQIYNLSNFVRTYIDIMCINIHRRYKKMININNVLWGR